MSRLSIAAACLLMASVPATALVGGAPAASPDAAQIVIMLSGSQGGFCSGVVLAQHLALTAAHCVLPGADYKLIDRDISGLVKLKHISAIARHPQFDADAALRHRVTADVALLRLAVPMPVAPATLAPSGSVAVGDRFIVLGYGVATPSDGSSGGTVRAATLVATGQPGTLQFRLVDPATKNERAGLGACVTATRGHRCFATSTARRWWSV
jgi:Trypsin